MRSSDRQEELQALVGWPRKEGMEAAVAVQWG